MGGNDSYCRLYIYEFVNSKKNKKTKNENFWQLWVFYGEVPTAQFYLLRMKIKVESKAMC